MDKTDLDFGDIIENLDIPELEGFNSEQEFEQLVENLLFSDGFSIAEELIIDNLPPQVVGDQIFWLFSDFRLHLCSFFFSLFLSYNRHQ